MNQNESLKMIEMAGRGNSNVLITGPTGSGKSHLAKQIHLSSGRRMKPFVTVNLACLHEGTFESELFGHERGAFTGAEQRRVGRLEQAQGGTVFLDEVGELSPRLQARLLEFLQSRTINPVGSNREIKLDVRVIAATNRDLVQCVKNGSFREDLFHRLRVIAIQLPSLIERAEEFDSILHQCIEDVCRNCGRNILRITEEVAQRFENYDWPGNFRELRNVLEYAVLSSDGSEIGVTDLPSWFGKSHPEEKRAEDPTPSLGVAEVALILDYEKAMNQFEKLYFSRILRRFGGKINHTARKVNMNKTTLIRRMRFHGLTAEQFIGVQGA